MLAINPANHRFAFKAALSVSLAFFLSLWLGLPAPRWAVLTAALVIATPAFISGASPMSAHIRHRGILRILGTLIGGAFSFLLMHLSIPSPLLWVLIALWVGFCAWGATHVDQANSYYLGLSGFTVLIIFVSAAPQGGVTSPLILARVSEVMLGSLCAMAADWLLAKRSVKQQVDQALTELLLAQWRYLQVCLQGHDNQTLSPHWSLLLSKTLALRQLRRDLFLDGLRGHYHVQRLHQLEMLSYTLLTIATEIAWAQPSPTTFADRITSWSELKEAAANGFSDIKLPRRWQKAMQRAIGLVDAIHQHCPPVKVRKVSHHFHISLPLQKIALLNAFRGFLVTVCGYGIWYFSGWPAAGGMMIALTVVTLLSVMSSRPRLAAWDFVLSTFLAIPIGGILYFAIFPWLQGNMWLEVLPVALLALAGGWVIPSRRPASLGTLLATLNILGISHPLALDNASFLQAALAQFLGALLAWIVLHIGRDNSADKKGKALMGELVRVTLGRFYHYQPVVITTLLWKEVAQIISLYPQDFARHQFLISLMIFFQQVDEFDTPLLTQDACQTMAKTLHQLTSCPPTQRVFYLDQLLSQLTKLPQAETSSQRAPLSAVILALKDYRQVLAGNAPEQ